MGIMWMGSDNRCRRTQDKCWNGCGTNGRSIGARLKVVQKGDFRRFLLILRQKRLNYNNNWGMLDCLLIGNTIELVWDEAANKWGVCTIGGAIFTVIWGLFCDKCKTSENTKTTVTMWMCSGCMMWITIKSRWGDVEVRFDLVWCCTVKDVLWF